MNIKAQYLKEPVGYTCPSIDKLIDYIAALEGKTLKPINIKTIKARLEKLRTANHKLRSWGESNADKLDTIIETLREN